MSFAQGVSFEEDESFEQGGQDMNERCERKSEAESTRSGAGSESGADPIFAWPKLGSDPILVGALLALGLAGSAWAQQADAPVPEFDVGDGSAARAAAEFRTLDEEVQDLKKLAVDLNRDLFLLEEELLFPASTQVSVFVSMDVGAFFALDSIEVQLDGKDIASYLYTDREVDALYRGGVQRLFAGNLRAGDHELVAFFTGDGPHDREYRRGATLTFEKGIGPKYIELKISDRESRLQPEFVVAEWE